MDLGLIKSVDEQKGSYLGYVLQYFTMYRRFSGETQIHEDHERATSLIVQYCIDKGSVRFYRKNNKTYPEITSYDLMRTHVAELLVEVMRIKAEGDYESGKALINKYGVHVDPELRDEVVARSRAIGYPSRFVYVMPYTELVKDESGSVIDVKLSWYSSILDQARGWRKMERVS
jgi:dipeptidyl-peptidase-3